MKEITAKIIGPYYSKEYLWSFKFQILLIIRKVSISIKLNLFYFRRSNRIKVNDASKVISLSWYSSKHCQLIPPRQQAKILKKSKKIIPDEPISLEAHKEYFSIFYLSIFLNNLTNFWYWSFLLRVTIEAFRCKLVSQVHSHFSAALN